MQEEFINKTFEEEVKHFKVTENKSSISTINRKVKLFPYFPFDIYLSLTRRDGDVCRNSSLRKVLERK